MAPEPQASGRPLTDRLAALLADHMARTGASEADVARELGVRADDVGSWLSGDGDAHGADEFARLDTPARLGAWLRARIAESGLSVRRLAEETESVSTATVYNWLNGEHLPPPPTGEDPDRFDLLLRHPALDLNLRRRLRLDEVRRRLTGTSLQAAAERPPDWPARALPAANRTFTGRGEERRRLDRLLTRHARGTAVVISTLTGMGGAGKTALAVHWARTRDVRATFPDGCLYVNLNGYAESPPLSAEAALRKLLQQLDVDPRDQPADPDALATAYQAALDGRRLLIVLDNARTEPQVRPLLPADPACLAVVTSRNRLQGLAVTNGPVTHLRLDVLPAREAAALLRRLIGDLAAGSEEDFEALARTCGNLPLALQIAAADYAARAGLQTIREYAEALAGRRLDALAVGPTDPDLAVAAVLDNSYRNLPPEPQRAYRLLGLHPGLDWTPEAAASLLGGTGGPTRALLAELADAHLLAEVRPGRFAFHDLVREHAARTARAAETEEERRAATGRLLDHYLHTAYAADRLLAPSRDPIALGAASAATTPPSSIEEAMAWFDAEHRVLLAAVDHAAATGHDGHAWRLAWSLSDFLDFQGWWHDMATAWRTGVEAAARLDDHAAHGIALRTLAYACLQLERFDDARHHLGLALAVFDGIGDHTGLAHTHVVLSHVSEGEGRLETMIADLELALAHYRIDGSAAGEARVLNGIGWGHARLGRYRDALPYCTKALALYRDVGDRLAQAGPLDSLGYIHHHLGRHREAVALFHAALAVHTEFGNRLPQANVLVNLGDAHRDAGEHGAAGDAWRRALAILEEIDHPEAREARERLASLPGGADGGTAPDGPPERDNRGRAEEGAMIINVDRSSVATGDGARSHAETVELPAASTIAEAVAYLRMRKYLAPLAGGKATWLLEVNGRPAAVIAQQWAEPKFAIDPSDTLGSFGEEVSLMFRYRAQIDPDDLYDTLTGD